MDRRGGIDYSKSPFREEVLVQYKHAWDKLTIVSIITRKDVKKPDFCDVISRLEDFVMILGSNSSDNVWDRKRKEWINDFG